MALHFKNMGGGNFFGFLVFVVVVLGVLFFFYLESVLIL